MARRGRSQTVFFRHDGAVQRDVYMRINPTAVRFSQGGKKSVSDTNGGYFKDVFQSSDPQYQGLLLPDFTIEAETGVAFRKELKTIDWIWRHNSDRKGDNSPADTYFFDLIENGPFQEIERDVARAYLIEIMHFAWDDTVESPYHIRFVMQCKILRDLFWEVEDPGGAGGGLLGTLGGALGGDTGAAIGGAVDELGNVFNGGGTGTFSVEDVLGGLAGQLGFPQQDSAVPTETVTNGAATINGQTITSEQINDPNLDWLNSGFDI